MTAATWIAGSEADFVAMMNRKAKDLGMYDTHFTNATGLYNQDHYSTVKDLAILLQYALANDDFYRALCTRDYRASNDMICQSILYQEMASQNIPANCIMGGKTGYTKEAGLCLASFTKIHGKAYLFVTAGAEGNSDTKPYHILDAVAVYDDLKQKL